MPRPAQPLPSDSDVPERQEQPGSATICGHRKRADCVFPVAVQGSLLLQRRALIMAGVAGVVSCAFPRVAVTTAIGSASAAGNRRFSVPYKGPFRSGGQIQAFFVARASRFHGDPYVLLRIHQSRDAMVKYGLYIANSRPLKFTASRLNQYQLN